MREAVEDFEQGAEGGLSDLLPDPVGTLRRRWLVMLLVLLIGLAGSATLFLTMAERYRAQTTVLVARQQVSERMVEPTFDEDSLSQVDGLAAEVLSRANLQKIVSDRGLYADLQVELTLEEIIDRMRKDITIEQAPGVTKGGRNESAEVFVIAFEHGVPTVAADVANDLAQLFVQASLETRHRQHRLTTEFLRRELEGADRELREQNRLIADFRRLHRGALPAELQANIARFEQLQGERQSLALQIAEAEASMIELASEEDTSPEGRLVALRAELRRQLSLHTEKHPDVISTRREVEALEAELAAATPGDSGRSRGSLRTAAQTRLAALRARLAETQREISELDSRVERTPAVEEELAALEGKAEIQAENYREFLRKVQDAQLSENLLLAQQGERVSILNRAFPPTRPVRARWKFLLVGIAASLALSGGLGIGLELLDPVLVTPGQVESASELPVVGWIGRIA